MNLIENSNDKMTVNLHPGQTQAWDSKRRQVFVIAGTQSGKTSFTPLWLDREIRVAGHGDYLAVTATYDLFKLKFLPEMRNYFCHLFGWEYQVSERVITKAYKPRMYDRIIMRSADAEGGLESASAKAAVLDECGQDKFKATAYDAVMRRLSLSRGRILGATTPYNLGWLKTQVFDKWRGGDDTIQVVQFKSIMNPVFPKAEYYERKANMPTWKFEMFYNGNFSRPAGLIYEDFTDKHIIPDFEIPLTWRRYLGVDFGAVHTAKIFLAQDPDSKIYYLYRESLEGGKTTQQHVDGVKKYHENNLLAWGGAKSETQQRMDWIAAGLVINEPPIWDVEGGIDRVINLLKSGMLYVFKSCVGVIDEFGTYAREINDNGEPTEKIRDKNDYHHLDALRYVASGINVPLQIFV